MPAPDRSSSHDVVRAVRDVHARAPFPAVAGEVQLPAPRRPPVGLDDDKWVVDVFLHIWEQHLRLSDAVSWLRGRGMRMLRRTDYYEQEIPLDVTCDSTSPVFPAMVDKLPVESECNVIDMIVRPCWTSLFGQKAGG